MTGEPGKGNWRNGGRTGNGNYRNGRSPQDPPATSQRPRVLRLSIHETEDIESDRGRLQTVIETLRGFPGSDLVRLTVHTVGGDKADLALAPVSASEPLRQVLVKILGDNGEVAIEAV